MNLLREYIRELISEKRYDPPVEQDVVHGLTFEEMRTHLSRHFGKAKITLTDSPLVLEKSHNPGQGLKPEGIWYACGTEWLDFLETEMSGPSKRQYQVWALKVDMSKVKQMNDAKTIEKFAVKYRDIEKYIANVDLRIINWSLVAKDFSGIECCPYPVKGIDNVKDIWYYSLDVPSGCIWDSSAIVNTMLVAERKEEGWEVYV